MLAPSSPRSPLRCAAGAGVTAKYEAMGLSNRSLSLPSRIIQSRSPPAPICRPAGSRASAGSASVSRDGLRAVADAREPKTRRMLVTTPQDRPLGAQIIACDPGMMAEAGRDSGGVGLRPDRHETRLSGQEGRVERRRLAFGRIPSGRAVSARCGGPSEGPVTMKMPQELPGSVGRRSRRARPAPSLGLSAATVHGRHAGSAVRGRADWERSQGHRASDSGHRQRRRPDAGDARGPDGVSGCGRRHESAAAASATRGSTGTSTRS